jgi:putative lipoic acid-binding regulatory protein
MDDERSRAIALLEATHKFPVVYEFSVITYSTDEVFVAIRGAVAEGLTGGLGEGDHQMVPSRGGKYTSHRFRVPCESAVAVLELYARVKQVEGVVTVL